MWKKTIILLTLMDALFGVTSAQHLETSNFEFLSKYSPKQYRTILHLKISNASISKVDPKLKYLKNLEYLDLSHNNIQISSIPPLASLKTLKLNGNSLKSINMTSLPPNVEVLDISNNLLSHIPKDWRSLRSLKTLYLHKNPMDCECINVMNFERIVKSDISVPESVTCHSPSKYIGKDIGAINCSLGDIMLYDEPVEGSGASDIFEENEEERLNIPIVYEGEEEEEERHFDIVEDKIEENLMPTKGSAETTTTELIPDEGSGDDEGSGLEFPMPESGVLGCIENCSTPGPVGSNDEKFASPLPSIVQQLSMVWEDLNVMNKPVTTTPLPTTEAPTTTTSTTTTEAPIESPPVVSEEPILRSPKRLQESSSPVKSDVEMMSNGDNVTEFEKATAVPQNSTAVYAIVGILVFVAVLFLICFVKKRRSQRRNNRRDDAPNAGEEMKPLSNNKPAPIQSIVNEKQKPSKIIPEGVPLINGKHQENGKGGSPILRTFVPLQHPERGNNLVNHDDGSEPDADEEYRAVPDQVEYRSKDQPELLTPQRERVTIRESEIPDSIPKTPLLVHRQKNSEGEIITTVVP